MSEIINVVVIRCVLAYKDNRGVDDEREGPLIGCEAIVLVDVITDRPVSNVEDEQSVDETLDNPLEEDTG